MKKIAALGALAALFVLTGCPDKKVNVEGEGTGSETITTQTPPPAPAPSGNAGSDAIDGEVIGSVYFDFDKFNIRPDMQSVVDEASSNINARGSYKVVIEGNTDEFGTDEYNYALGTKRAIAVREALVVKGADKDSIRVISFGESKPICTEKTKECYQQNRRGDIKVAE